MRIPKKKVSLELLSKFKGLVGPSANRYNHISPTSKYDVVEELGKKISYVLDGGKCKIGIESTIIRIDITSNTAIIVRKGMINKKLLERKIGYPFFYDSKTKNFKYNDKVPGNSYNHYCPNAILLVSSKVKRIINILLKTKMKVGLISSKEISCEIQKHIYYIKIEKSSDLYAQNIYRNLRFFDKYSLDIIIIESIPKSEKWLAINERVRKACLKRYEFSSYVFFHKLFKYYI